MPGSPATNGDALEVEWQFEAHDLAQVERWLRAQPAHAALAFVDRGAKVQVDRYLDTDDWRVYRAGYALRVRTAELGAEATLKSFGSAPAETAAPARRREINEPLPAGADDPLAAPGAVGERLRLLCAGHPLRTLFHVTTRRHGFRVTRQGTELAVIALDEARIGDDVPGAPVLRRVEIEESVPGGLAAIASFVDALRAACALAPASASKFGSGLRAVGLTPAPAIELGPLEADPDGPVIEFALAALRRAFAAFIAREPGTRLGEDIEELHQMRVATRRMRAIGSVFAPVLPGEIVALREELRWIAQALGAVRDLDVQLDELAALRRDADWDEGTALGPLVEIVNASHTDAHGALLAALDSERYERLVTGMTALLRRGAPAVPASESAESGAPVAVFAVPVLGRRYRRFQRDATLLMPGSPAPEYHAVRVRAKRFRYALEQFAGLYGRDADRTVRRVKAVQDLLGEHQDSDVAIAWLRRLAREHGAELPPETLLAMGELMERHRARMERLRGDWPGAHRQLRRAWSRLRRAVARAARADDPPDDDEPVAPEPEPSGPAGTRRTAAPPIAGRAVPARHPRTSAEGASASGIAGRTYARLRAGVAGWRIRGRRRENGTSQA